MASLGSVDSSNADSSLQAITEAEKSLAHSTRVNGVRVPKGQKLTILKAMQRGEKLTVGKALNTYGIYALSQRIGELRRGGWPIYSREVVTAGGARIAEYWLATAGDETEEDHYPLREASFY